MRGPLLFCCGRILVKSGEAHWIEAGAGASPTAAQYAEEEAWRVTTDRLAKRLEEQNLKLMDVNEKLRVVG